MASPQPALRSSLKSDSGDPSKPKIKKAVSIDRPVNTMGGDRDMNFEAMAASALAAEPKRA